MRKKQTREAAYRDERPRVRSMSDAQLKRRRAELEGIIERATRDFVANLEKSVAIGSMTVKEAADEFAAFKRQLRDAKIPFGPN